MGVSVKGAGIKAAAKFQHENGAGIKAAAKVSAWERCFWIQRGARYLLGSFAVPEYSHDAFVDAIVEWIIADDQVWRPSLMLFVCWTFSFQSINVIECPQLRQIFLMLWEDLTDADIPHRTYIRKCVIETWEKYIATLKSEMEVSLFLPAMY